MAASEEDSYLLLFVSEQVKEIVKKSSECDNVKESNNNKSKEKMDLFRLFYGSDAEDTDAEDWPQIDDETRKRMQLERGTPIYNKSPPEEIAQIRRINTYICSVHYQVRLESRNLPKAPPPQPLPLPPPPSPPPPSRDFRKKLRLLDERVKQLRNLRRPGLESPC